ncbi:redoxin domain-containing protein [Ignavibacterium sp.]|uniref:peroxiredoxin family protein n=1 Tax=Ignavibacterium sp. TaxID=2651167 RepID=UPI00307F4BDE
MKVGDIVPDFSILNQYGEAFYLYKNLTRKVLLIFYPKDNTPVCSNQLRDYQLNIDRFEKIDVQLVAINIADKDTHKNFCENIDIKFPVLSDIDKIVSEQYDALNLFGMNKRMVVLVGKDKRIKMIRKMFSITYTASDELVEEINSLPLK